MWQKSLLVELCAAYPLSQAVVACTTSRIANLLTPPADYSCTYRLHSRVLFFRRATSKNLTVRTQFTKDFDFLLAQRG